MFGVEVWTGGKDLGDVVAILRPPGDQFVDAQVLDRCRAVCARPRKDLVFELGLGHIDAEVHSVRRRTVHEVGGPVALREHLYVQTLGSLRIIKVTEPVDHEISIHGVPRLGPVVQCREPADDCHPHVVQCEQILQPLRRQRWVVIKRLCRHLRRLSGSPLPGGEESLLPPFTHFDLICAGALGGSPKVHNASVVPAHRLYTTLDVPSVVHHDRSLFGGVHSALSSIVWP